jgi:hypothetical protein
MTGKGLRCSSIAIVSFRLHLGTIGFMAGRTGCVPDKMVTALLIG